MLNIESDFPRILTDRETQVLTLVAAGLSAKEVALSLQIAPCTVERHIENVRLKTRTRNRAHMVAVVIQGGWLASVTSVACLGAVASAAASLSGAAL
jgi:LuxR family transcriptional regulator of spore coat protein